MAHGKKYREASQRYDKTTPYPAREALELVKTLASAKFDETVEVVYNLGIDPRKADQLVRGPVSLPHGTGKDGRLAGFSPAAKETEAGAAGAELALAGDDGCASYRQDLCARKKCIAGFGSSIRGASGAATGRMLRSSSFEINTGRRIRVGACSASWYCGHGRFPMSAGTECWRGCLTSET